jgi:hypothetical protein
VPFIVCRVVGAVSVVRVQELRNPLQTIIAMTEFMRATALSPEQTECLTTVRTASDLMHQLVNDVLDLKQLQAGKMQVQSQPTALRPMLDTIIRMYRNQIQQKGLDFRVDVADNLPAVIGVDPKRLMQILVNLLSNAVKVATDHLRNCQSSALRSPVLSAVCVFCPACSSLSPALFGLSLCSTTLLATAPNNTRASALRWTTPVSVRCGSSALPAGALTTVFCAVLQACLSERWSACLCLIRRPN